jgi:integrase/recombinase XerC
MFISDFTSYLSSEKRYSINTVQAYQRDLEQFFIYVQSSYEITDIKYVSHVHIRSWLAKLKENNIENRSINRKISTLKSFYKYLLRTEVVESSPMTKIISPKNVKRLPVFVNEQNMQDMLKHNLSEDSDFKTQTDQLIVELLYQTGIRRAELLNIKCSDIDFYNNSIKILGKGNKERILPLMKEMIEQLKTYILFRDEIVKNQHSFLFSIANGKPIYAKYVHKVVKDYLSASTTISKKSPHVLRHTFATHLLNQGADLNAVKELLGHANLNATQIYTHNTIDKLKEIHKKAHPKA